MLVSRCHPYKLGCCSCCSSPTADMYREAGLLQASIGGQFEVHEYAAMQVYFQNLIFSGLMFFRLMFIPISVAVVDVFVLLCSFPVIRFSICSNVRITCDDHCLTFLVLTFLMFGMFSLCHGFDIFITDLCAIACCCGVSNNGTKLSLMVTRQLGLLHCFSHQ